MKTRRWGLLLAVLLALALGASTAPAHAQEVDAGTVWTTGGAYRLLLVPGSEPTGAGAAAPLAAGGGYRLLAPAAPQGTGTPCCCMHIPCVRNQ